MNPLQSTRNNATMSLACVRDQAESRKLLAEIDGTCVKRNFVISDVKKCKPL